jgi:hypothetical protein
MVDPAPGQDRGQGQDDGWAPPPDPTRDRFSAWDDLPPGRSATPPPPPAPPWVGPANQPYAPYGQYQQAPAPGGQYYPPPNNYLVFGILTTLFCFMPFGIVSIIKATSVNTLWSQGRSAEAFRAAEQAKNWAVAALVALPVCFGAFVALAVIGAFAS